MQPGGEAAPAGECAGSGSRRAAARPARPPRRPRDRAASGRRCGVPGAGSRPATTRGPDGRPEPRGRPGTRCPRSRACRPPCPSSERGRWSGTIPTVSLPARLGRLRQVDRLGVGGFASVWLYHDDELDSDVAVKALADNWAQRLDIRDRFLQEARILRRADSDHVVRVYDVGEVDGTPYFVMTYADQGTLSRTCSSASAAVPRPHRRPGHPGGGRAWRCSTHHGVDPPRHQAAEPAAAQRRRRRRADGRRPRRRQGDAARERADPGGRHPGVHGARAGHRRRRRRPRRRPRAGRGRLPDAHRPRRPRRHDRRPRATLQPPPPPSELPTFRPRSTTSCSAAWPPTRTTGGRRSARSSTRCSRWRPSADRTLLVSPPEPPGVARPAGAAPASARLGCCSRWSASRCSWPASAERWWPPSSCTDHAGRFPAGAGRSTIVRSGSHHPS